jgi:hypothetical protein
VAADNLKSLLIVYQTMTGGTLQMAEAAAAGAGAGSTVQVKMRGSYSTITSRTRPERLHAATLSRYAYTRRDYVNGY